MTILEKMLEEFWEMEKMHALELLPIKYYQLAPQIIATLQHQNKVMREALEGHTECVNDFGDNYSETVREALAEVGSIENGQTQ